MSVDEEAFMADFKSAGGMNAAEASQLKWWILKRVKFGDCTADDIYKESECGDIAMYLALHELVINNLIIGPNPYDREPGSFNAHGGHTNMHYKLANNQAAHFFADSAKNMAERWDPTVWSVNTVSP